MEGFELELVDEFGVRGVVDGGVGDGGDPDETGADGEPFGVGAFGGGGEDKLLEG